MCGVGSTTWCFRSAGRAGPGRSNVGSRESRRLRSSRSGGDQGRGAGRALPKYLGETVPSDCVAGDWRVAAPFAVLRVPRRRDITRPKGGTEPGAGLGSDGDRRRPNGQGRKRRTRRRRPVDVVVQQRQDEALATTEGEERREGEDGERPFQRPSSPTDPSLCAVEMRGVISAFVTAAAALPGLDPDDGKGEAKHGNMGGAVVRGAHWRRRRREARIVTRSRPGGAGPGRREAEGAAVSCPVRVRCDGWTTCLSVCRDGDVRLAVLVGPSGPEPLGAAQDGVLHQRCKAPAAPLTNWPETELTERRGASGLVVASLSRSGIADLQPAAARPQILVSRHFGGRISAGPG